MQRTPKGLTSIGNSAFCGCSHITSIVVDENNPIYDSREDCNAIIATASGTLLSGCQNTVVPQGVTSIAAYAFCNCTFLTSIVLPEGTTSIGGYAFRFCDGLKSIEIPDSLKSIGDEAFSFCHSLSNIKLPEKMISIGAFAFEHCESLTSIDFPEGLTNIENGVFSNCRSLTSIELPDGVEKIGQGVFWQCGSLRSIILPFTVSNITEGAFYECTSLKDVFYLGTEEDRNVIELDNENNACLLNAIWHYNFDPEKTFEIIFITNGGSAISPLMVGAGQSVEKPNDPTKDNYLFGGWFADPELSVLYDFASPITSNTTLYAKWNVMDGWVTINGETYYYENGVVKTGWLKDAGNWYYLDQETGVMQTGFVQVGDKTYYRTSSGVMLTGWISITEPYSAMNSNLVEKWLYAESSGALATGWRYIGGKWYYFGDDHRMYYDGYDEINGKTYYFDYSGQMLTGWISDFYYIGHEEHIPTIDWYYANSSGELQKGWQKIGGVWYYFNQYYKMEADGVRVIDEKEYFFYPNGAMGTGWCKRGSNTWYYANSSGVLQKGWQKIGGVWYYFKFGGEMAAKEWVPGYYWISASGAWTYQPIGSWKQNSIGRWFGDTSGWYAKNETIKINGWYYTFNSAGYLVE